MWILWWCVCLCIVVPSPCDCSHAMGWLRRGYIWFSAAYILCVFNGIHLAFWLGKCGWCASMAGATNKCNCRPSQSECLSQYGVYSYVLCRHAKKKKNIEHTASGCGATTYDRLTKHHEHRSVVVVQPPQLMPTKPHPKICNSYWPANK